MTSRYTNIVGDWYYFVADTSPSTQVWSTASNAYVAMAAAAFDTWLSAGQNDSIFGPSAFGQFFTSQGTTNNGSGKVRIQLLDTSLLTTGQKFNFADFSGTPLLNGNQIITVIDATHIDVTAISFVALDIAGVGTIGGAAYMDTQANLFSSLGINASQSSTPTADVRTGLSADVTLTNPMSQYYDFQFTTTGKKIILPPMNAPNSIAKGAVFTIRAIDAASSAAVNVFLNDGTTFIASLGGQGGISAGIGETRSFALQDNTTVNGTLRVLPFFSTSGSYVKGVYSISRTTTVLTLGGTEAVLVNRLQEGKGLALNYASGHAADISTAGPTAGGRDQAGAFTAGQEVSFWFIYGSGQPTSAVWSLASPTGGLPTLPTNYTHAAYACTVILVAGPNLPAITVAGSWVHHNAFQTILAGGGALVETAVSTAGFVPATATNIQLLQAVVLTSGAGGGTAESSRIRHTTGANFTTQAVTCQVASVAAQNNQTTIIPNVAQNVFYSWTGGGANTAARALSLFIQSYECPNGGP